MAADLRERIAEHRLREARTALARDGLDALLLINSTNLLFLSGYPYVDDNLARPFYLLVPRRGAPVLLVHKGRQHEARAHSWIRDVRTYDRLSLAPVDELVALARELGLRNARVGAELGFEQRPGLPPAELRRIDDALAPGGLVDAADLLWGLRAIKASWDVAALRRACSITAKAYARTYAAASGGQAESQVLRRMIWESMQLGGGSPWGAITSGADNYDVVLGPGTERQLEPGDMVWMDGGCRVEGLWSDFGRAAVVGRPASEQVDGQRLIHEITMEGVAMVGPGVPVREIAGALNRRVEGVGLPVTANISELAARVGHGIGLDVTEPPHLSEEDDTILQPGMVVSIEPGVSTDYGIFHVEENVLVTESGREVLSNASRELVVLPESAAGE